MKVLKKEQVMAYSTFSSRHRLGRSSMSTPSPRDVSWPISPTPSSSGMSPRSSLTPSLRYAFQTRSKLYLVSDFFNGGELYFYLSNGRFSEVRPSPLYHRLEPCSFLRCWDRLRSGSPPRPRHRLQVRCWPRGLCVEIWSPRTCSLTLMVTFESPISVSVRRTSRAIPCAPSAVLPSTSPLRFSTRRYVSDSSSYGISPTARLWIGGPSVHSSLRWLPVSLPSTIATERSCTTRSWMLLSSSPPACPLKYPFRHICCSCRCLCPWFVYAFDICSKLLNRNPEERLGHDGVEGIKNHPFFKTIDWEKLVNLQVTPPFKPKVTSAESTENVDYTFTSELPFISATAKDAVIPDENAFDGFSYNPNIMH